jgi:hypothetical protein
MRIGFALTAAALAVTLAGCASTSSPTAPQTAYQRDINAMTKYCTQTPAQLESMVSAVSKIEAAHAVSDGSVTALAGNLLTAVSAYNTKTSCVDAFGAYATLRTGG